jgi:UDP-glucose 4-epimerase
MNVLIFGGAGYVGYELSKLFAERGDTVTVFDAFTNGDTNARKKIHVLAGVIVREGTIADADAVSEVFEASNPEVVYNLAALHYIPYCVEHPREVFATNYRGLQNIIVQMNKRPNTKFIFASSASVYGSPSAVCNLETPVEPNDIYGASKLAGEHLITFQLTNYVIMRLFNVYGKFDPHLHLIPKVAGAAVRDEQLELGTASALRDFVYVEDAAKAFFVAQNAPAGEKYIIASGETRSVKDVVERIYMLADSNGKVRYETKVNMRTKDASYLCGDSTKLRSLGWQPTVDFDKGLASVIAAARAAEEYPST